MGARIDDSDLLARIADHIVCTKGATLADALKALNVPHPSHRRIYTKWDRRGLGLVTEAAWRARCALETIFDTTYAKGYDAGLFDGKASANLKGAYERGQADGRLLASLDAKKRSLISRVKARFWE